MQTKYKRTLTFIGSLIAICLFIGTSYLFYDKITNPPTEVQVDEELSINFINGSTIQSRNNEYNFSITNNGSTSVYYDIKIKNLKKYQENIEYSILSHESNISLNREVLKLDNNLIADNILISAGTTQNYSLQVFNNKETTFNIEIKKIVNPEEYFYSTILKNNKISELKTKPGEETSEIQEGLIEDFDDNGLIYYFRGDVTNNYVKFANALWRIVKINSDGTVKLILNDQVSDLTIFNSDDTDLDEISKATIAKSLNSYYDLNLNDYDNYISNSKYCFENSFTENSGNKAYNGYTRLITNKIPTSNCLGTKKTSKIGLLTADEVFLAGASSTNNNEKFYLYNKDITKAWWTSSLAESKNNDFYPFVISKEGKVEYNLSGTSYQGLRPVINIIRKASVSGTGSLKDPYLIKTS